MADWTELTVPLSERVEFASREWAAEADRYLQTKAAAAGSALDGLSCSLTERWQNSPPHLGWKDNVAGFSLRVEDGRIEVGVGPAPEADVEIDGDYNAILPIAWTILRRRRLDPRAGAARVRRADGRQEDLAEGRAGPSTRG